MIKNRYFKTTVGVAFEFAVGDNLTTAGGVTAVTMKDVVASSAAGNVYVFRNTGGPTGPYQVIINTALATAYRKQEIFFSYVTGQNAAGQWEIKNTSPLIAESITATLIPYAAPTLQVADVTNAGVGVVSIQQELSFRIIETTPGQVPLPTWDYVERLTLGEAAAWTAIATKINLGKEEEFFTAVAAADGITITSTDATRHFILTAVILPTAADNTDTGVYYDYTVTTPAFAGSGTLTMVNEMYKENNVKRGVTHYYPEQGVTADEFGLPLTVPAMIATTTFDIVKIAGYKMLPSPTPLGVNQQKHYIFIAVPAGEGSKIVAIFA